MSFLPVSEALLRLEIEGLLESRPRAGTRVRIPSPEDVQGHYVVREALEVQAAMRFTQVATPGERAELKKLAVRVDQLSTAAGSPAVSDGASEAARAHRAVRAVPGAARRDREDARAGVDLVLRDAAAQAGRFADPASGAGRSRVQRRPRSRRPRRCGAISRWQWSTRWKCCSRTSGCGRRPAGRSIAATTELRQGPLDLSQLHTGGAVAGEESPPALRVL